MRAIAVYSKYIAMSVISVRPSGKPKALGLGHVYIKGSYIISSAYNTIYLPTFIIMIGTILVLCTTHLMVKHNYTSILLLLRL